jgi:hypothetical protein
MTAYLVIAIILLLVYVATLWKKRRCPRLLMNAVIVSASIFAYAAYGWYSAYLVISHGDLPVEIDTWWPHPNWFTNYVAITWLLEYCHTEEFRRSDLITAVYCFWKCALYFSGAAFAWASCLRICTLSCTDKDNYDSVKSNL